MLPSTITANRVESRLPQITGTRNSAGKPKILVVEDHDDTREMLRIILEMKGYLVVDACNGLEGVELARSERPDLILMDGSLPILDGLEATRQIRANLQLRNVCIIAMNGWGTPSYHNDAIAAGCNDCMVKPLDFDRLEGYLALLFTPSGLAAA